MEIREQYDVMHKCRRKVQYLSLESAERAVSETLGVSRKPYACPYCSQFHVGHKLSSHAALKYIKGCEDLLLIASHSLPHIGDKGRRKYAYLVLKRAISSLHAGVMYRNKTQQQGRTETLGKETGLGKQEALKQLNKIYTGVRT